MLYKHLKLTLTELADASTLAHKIKAAQYVRKTLAKYAQLNGKKALKHYNLVLDLVGKSKEALQPCLMLI